MSIQTLIAEDQPESFAFTKESEKEIAKAISKYQELLDQIKEGGFFVAPWADSAENEAKIKEDCKATIRCYPTDIQHQAEGQSCFYSGNPATHMAIFARAY